jgi:hypothetical protein
MYQAVTDSQCTGIMTVTSQQQNLLVQSRDSFSEPQKAFKQDIRELLCRSIKRGDEIILVCDLNETSMTPLTAFARLWRTFTWCTL